MENNVKCEDCKYSNFERTGFTKGTFYCTVNNNKIPIPYKYGNIPFSCDYFEKEVVK